MGWVAKGIWEKIGWSLHMEAKQHMTSLLSMDLGSMDGYMRVMALGPIKCDHAWQDMHYTRHKPSSQAWWERGLSPKAKSTTQKKK